MENSPLVSVIIPALNEEKRIGKCLESLRNLNFNKDNIEILVVDNGSQDKTIEIAGSFGAKVYVIKHGPISKLRNYGASMAKGKFYAFVDADCVVSKDWIKNALLELDNKDVGATGSNYLSAEKGNWVEEAWEFNKMTVDDRCEVDWIQSGNLIIKKYVFDAVAGFDENLVVSEDSDICYRIRDLNYKIISNTDIKNYHLGFSRDIKSFFRKELWHGKGTVRVFKKHLSKKRYFKVMGLAIFFAVCLIGFFIGVLFLNFKLAISTIGVILAFSLLLSLKMSLKKKSFKYFFQLSVLYLIFGITRAISVLNLRNWSKK